MSVAIVTDTAASLPPQLAAERGVIVIPLVIHIDGESHDDGELPLANVLARPANGVSTSGPAPGQVAATLAKVLEHADAALVLTIAQTMSSTFDAARLGAQAFGDRVRVVDTRTAAGAEGLVVLAAHGETLDEAEATARQAIERVRLVATVPNLDRLVRSGRVPGIAGWAGNKLGVNPLFQFRDGAARPLRPAFSRAAALDRITAALTGAPVTGSRLHVAALHAEALDDANALLDRVRVTTEPATAFVGEFSPVMVTHTGPGLVGLAWWWEP